MAHTAIFKMDNNKDLQYSTENSEGSLGKNGYIHMYGWSTLLSTETIKILLTGYMPIQNKKLQKKIHLYAFFLFICLVIGTQPRTEKGREKDILRPLQHHKKNYMSVLR